MTDKTIKQLQNEFDEIVDWFGSEQSDIDESIVMYEKSIELAKEIKQRLSEADNKITKIHADFEGK